MHPQVLADAPGACPNCEMALVQIPGGKEEQDGATEAADATPAYACAMRCEGDKTYPEPGNCPVCEMRLDPVEPQPPRGGAPLAVPIGAVLDSGTRKLVYVEKEDGLFEPREVVLGPRAASFYPVLSGLNEGERVVTRGGFLIDSQFQITGQPSLFYPGGLMGDPAPAEHVHDAEKTDDSTEASAAAEAAEHDGQDAH